jgi:hypothetical protein
MPLVYSFDETPDSREFEKDPPKYTLKYISVGEFNDAIVQSYALAVTPIYAMTPAGILRRQNIGVRETGHAQYEVSVEYGKKNREVGSINFSFDTTGGTFKVKAGKQHIHTYYPSGTTGTPDPDPYKGAIGVQNGEVEGVDLVIPALKLVYTFKHPAGIISAAYMKTLARATGKTNLNPFQSFDVDELLFIGATGNEGTDSDSEVVYNFIAIQNETSLTIGTEFSGIAKKGHECLWIEFVDHLASDATSAVKPKRVFIERVYDPIDFAGTFGWGGP